MSRPENLRDPGIVLRVLVTVSHQHGDGRSRCLPLKDTGQDFHPVRFLPLCGFQILSRLPPVHIGLNVRLGEGKPRRAAIDDDTQTGSVGLSEGGDSEAVSKCISCHASSLLILTSFLLLRQLHHADTVRLIDLQLPGIHHQKSLLIIHREEGQ